MGTEIVRKYGIIMALSLVLMLSVVDIFFVTAAKPKLDRAESVRTEKICESKTENEASAPLRISEIEGPMITQEASSVVCEYGKVPACRDLGGYVWTLLFVAYVALLVMNLAWGFFKNPDVQWVWEAIMTGIFVSFWFVFDSCAQNLWYPLYVTKLAIAVYVGYLYFFLNRRKDG